MRRLAQQVAQNQGRLASDLTQLGRDQGVTLPTDADERSAKELEQLAKQSGIEFDRKSIDELIETQEDLVDGVKSAAKDGENQQLKQWASQILPILETDLTSAQSIKETVDSLPSTPKPQ